MKRVCLILLACSAGLAGCVEPEQLFREVPVADSTTWYSGEEFQTTTIDSVTVSIAFENDINRTATFYMVVGNEGSQTVLVAPEEFYYSGISHKINLYSREEVVTADTIFAIDPEIQLANINRQVAQATATYTNQSAMSAAGALLQLVGDVATIGQDKSDEQRRNEEEQRVSREVSQANNAANYDSQMSSLSDQRDYWANATLRKTTLFQHTAVGGRVAFPSTEFMSDFTLIVPVDTTVFKFEFKKEPLPGK